jgi:hypothetical protein
LSLRPIAILSSSRFGSLEGLKKGLVGSKGMVGAGCLCWSSMILILLMLGGMISSLTFMAPFKISWIVVSSSDMGRVE